MFLSTLRYCMCRTRIGPFGSGILSKGEFRMALEDAGAGLTSREVSVVMGMRLDRTLHQAE